MAAPRYPTLVPLFEELRGDVVLLRPYRPDDAPLLQEAVAESRDHLRPWMPWADTHQTVEESLDWINHVRANWITRTDMAIAMFDAADPARYVGGTGLHPRDWAVRYFEIGRTQPVLSGVAIRQRLPGTLRARRQDNWPFVASRYEGPFSVSGALAPRHLPQVSNIHANYLAVNGAKQRPPHALRHWGGLFAVAGSSARVDRPDRECGLNYRVTPSGLAQPGL